MNSILITDAGVLLSNLTDELVKMIQNSGGGDADEIRARIIYTMRCEDCLKVVDRTYSAELGIQYGKKFGQNPYQDKEQAK